MSSSSSIPRVLGAAVIIGLGAVAGFMVARERQTKAPSVTVAPAPATPDVQPDESPATIPESPKKPVPATLPDITLADMKGTPTRLDSFAGRPLMVNFWATWCAPCRREIPLLNKIRGERQAQNAEIVGIAVDFKEDVAKFLTKTPLNYPLLVGEEDGLAASEAFGMGMAFPFSVFVDSRKRILTIKLGELHEDEANFAFDRLQDIDKGVLTLEAAQQQVDDAFRTMAANRARTEAESGATDAH